MLPFLWKGKRSMRMKLYQTHLIKGYVNVFGTTFFKKEPFPQKGNSMVFALKVFISLVFCVPTLLH